MVKYKVPEKHEEHFNILVLHQNRVKRGSSETSFFQEKNIPKFIDFVLWGHEHDNRIQLEYCPTADCFISQPGSTVPTSLCDGESDEKQVAILTVNQNRFKFYPVTLETTRLVIFDTVSLLDFVTLEELMDYSNDTIEDTVKEGLHLEIEERLKQAEKILATRPR